MLLWNLNIGTSSFWSMPMTAVGVKVKDKKCVSGNQYQYWVKTAAPIIPGMFRLPVCVWRLMVQFRPPASMMPIAIAHPNLAIASSCRSPIIFSIAFRTLPTFGFIASFCCTRTIAREIKAPCRTKSVGSLSIGSSKSTASSRPVPAQDMPSAMAAPYRT